MTIFLLICVIASFAIVMYIQLRYAYANYPDSKNWLWLRLASSFLLGLLVGLLLFHRTVHGIALVGATLTPILVLTVAFTFLFPNNLQNVIPKRNEMDGKDPRR